MKSKLLASLAIVLLCGQAIGQTNDMDSELSKLADRLAAQIKDQGKKKVTVLDFADLEGGSSELGKYVAEQLTVDLVMIRNDYTVLDRANLKSILAEHKLTATGLINPDNAKKIGQFAGVDAIILGTIAPKDKHVVLTAKIITTDTAEIVGAAKADFKSDDTVQKLVSKPASEAPATGAKEQGDEKPKISKTFGDLRVELESLRIMDGNQYVLTMTLTNQNPKKSIWIAVGYELGGTYLRTTVTDPDGNEFRSVWESLSGLEYAWNNGGVTRSTEIKPADTATATLKFFSQARRNPTVGTCRLQMELLLMRSFRSGQANPATVQNLTTKIEAE